MATDSPPTNRYADGALRLTTRQGMPLASRELAYGIAMELAPRSSGYWQSFLTDEEGKTETPLMADEPIYGKQLKGEGGEDRAGLTRSLRWPG